MDRCPGRSLRPDRLRRHARRRPPRPGRRPALVEDGRLLNLDLEEIYRESPRCLSDLIRRSGLEL
ncbi:MAG TPA: hypothetical protein VLQ45_31090 [Thermoanaerobaculia bacterium]|nr:hypothetical protein [Thermoanaerobaculia bacterium]